MSYDNNYRVAALEPRVAVLESKVTDLENESDRTRGRLHEIESDRAILKLLVEGLSELRTNVKTLLEDRAGAVAIMRWKRWAIGTTIAAIAAVSVLIYTLIALSGSHG